MAQFNAPSHEEIELLVPLLLRNRSMRNFFAGYSHQQWHELVKLLVLLGIVSLPHAQKHQPLPQFSLDELRELVRNALCQEALGTALPHVQQQLMALKHQLEDINAGLDGGVAPASVRGNGTAAELPSPPGVLIVRLPSCTHVTHARTHSCIHSAGVAPLILGGPSDPLTQQQQQQQQQPPAARRYRPLTKQPLPAAARGRRSTSPVLAPRPPADWRLHGDGVRTWTIPGYKRTKATDEHVASEQAGCCLAM